MELVEEQENNTNTVNNITNIAENRRQTMPEKSSKSYKINMKSLPKQKSIIIDLITNY